MQASFGIAFAPQETNKYFSQRMAAHLPYFGTVVPIAAAHVLVPESQTLAAMQ